MSPSKETEQMYFPPSYIHEMTVSLPRSPPPSALGLEPAQPLSGMRQGKKNTLIGSEVFSSLTNLKEKRLHWFLIKLNVCDGEERM